MANKIGIVLALDGEREFTAAVQTAQKEVKMFQSELKGLSEEFEGSANSMEYLRKKQNVLTQQQQAYQRKLEAAQAGQKKANENWSTASKRLEELKKDLEKAENALKDMDKAGEQNTDAYKDQAKAVEELEKAIERQTIARTREAGSVATWNQRVNESQRALDRSNDEIEKNARYLREAETAADGCATSIDKMGREVKESAENMDDAGQKTSMFGDMLKANLTSEAIVGGVKALVNVAKEGAQALLELATDAAAYADEILTTSTVTGMSTDDLQAYQYAAELVDTSLETLTKSMAKNVKSMDSARKGSENYAEAYKKLGVEVTDADGNLRDSETVYWECIDALGAMTDETERDAISMQLFGKSAQDLNPLIAQGSAGIAALKEEAKDMGAVLSEDTLIALGGTDDALQRLSQQVDIFKRTVGANIAPVVEGVAGMATSALAGITEAISQPKSEFETFIDDVESANKELQTALDNADTAKENAIAEGEKIEYLGERLIALNGIESKSAAQRLEMDGIVQQLGEHIPQIAEAYDKEAGKVQLADGEIRNLITSTKELMVTQALQAQAQEVVNKLVEAQIQYDKASDRFKSLSDAKEAIKELQDEYAKLWDQRNDDLIDDAAFDRMESALLDRARNLSGVLSEALGEDINIDGAIEPFRYLSEAVLPDVESEMLDVSDSMTELEGSIADGNAALEDLNGVAEEVVGSLGDVKDGEKKAGDAADNTAETTEKSAKVIAGAFDLAKGAVEEYGEKAVNWLVEAGETAKKIAEEDIAKAAEAGAEAQKNALQDVLDTYHGYVDEIEADLQSKINPFEKFDTETGFGEDVTVEQMTENLNSQAEAFETYQKKLEAVKEHVGREIAPEFMQYIEDMGIEGTNTLDHILKTFEDEEPEKVRALSDAWCKNMDMTEDMAKAGAANQIAFEAAMGELGSTPVEFAGLQESIEKATQEASGLWGTMSAETEEALNAAAQTARDCGVKIPEGLSEGIASGEISPKQALAQLEGALQGSIDGMVQIAEEAGLEIPASITAGIESGDPEAMKTAYDKLISYIADNADTAALTEIMDKAGADSTDALGDHAEDAKIEGENVAQAGADGAAGKKPEYKAAGEGNIDEYVAAMGTGKGRAAQRAAEVAQAGYTAAGAYDAEFHDAGYNMSAGIAGGINDGGSLIANAIKGQVRSALAAGKAEADIKSPSKKFRKEIGQQIGNGVAFGIRDKASLAGNEAAKMSAQVYGKAAAWMAKYKKSHEVSLNDEKYYWDQVLQHVKKGTTAYNNAVKKLAVATFSGTDLSNSAATAAFKKIESNFGVSRKKTTGSGKNKKTVSKDAESYYSEIYNAANKYLSNMQTLNDWSLQAELEYWEAVQAQLKNGTQAWYDAQRQINSAKEGIAEEAADAAAALEEANSQIVSDAQDYVRKQKILNQMSTQDELVYWQGIAGTVKKGSDAWYDALEQINELNEQVQQEMEDAAEAAREAAEAQQEAFEDALEAIREEKEAEQERIRTTANVQSAILSKYKTYYKLSAKAEMDYWNIARQQFREGTDERIEADQAYFSARESYYEQLADLDEEYAEKKKDIDDELADSIKSLQDAYDDAVNSRKREILSSFNLFEGWDAEGYNKDKLLENLRTQVNGINFWTDQLEELGKKGVTQELLDELKAMGPDAAANLWSLNQMTGEELDEYIRLWEEKNRVAQEQARLDNESLWQETQDSITEARQKAQEELDAAKDEYDKAVADLNTGLTDGLKDLVTQAGDIGEDMVSALVESVRTGVKSVSDEIAKLKREAEEAQKLADKAAAEKAAEEEAKRKAEEEAAKRAAEEAKRKAEEEAKRKAEEEVAKRAEEEKAAKEAAQSASAPQTLQGFTSSASPSAETVSGSSGSAATVNGSDAILKIIQSGTKRSKKLTKAEKEKHVALWEYVVSNYGYAPGNSVYKKLADALGVKADKTVTNDQKEKILKALKKKGYASGTRAVWEDELAWILENARTEYLVRKADQAILQPMRAGDKVISSKGAENVYDFANNPGTFLQPYMRTALEQARAEMARENEALRRQMATLDRTGMGRLNRLMEQGTQQAPVVNVDNSGVLSMLGNLASALNRLVDLAENGQQVVLDTGALVGAIQQPMSRVNAAAQRRRNRGTF